MSGGKGKSSHGGKAGHKAGAEGRTQVSHSAKAGLQVGFFSAVSVVLSRRIVAGLEFTDSVADGELQGDCSPDSRYVILRRTD